ncbi:hypothetical protein DSO57_1020144 [Entomophthora muscae]|uniref:Uncharacterized protein n=1 Tax=Entomophthora muscae TaxID=34485 RepID=A0ACC2UPP4_9FUNG|nr:hypothetical protein DSO57_1020144 [Entomophthora muscae]
MFCFLSSLILPISGCGCPPPPPTWFEKIPGQLLYFLSNLPGRAHYLWSIGEILFRSLTSDDVKIFSPTSVLDSYPAEESLVSISIVVKGPSTLQDLSVLLEHGLSHTSWLLTGMLLMGLHPYLPHFPPTLSLWTPV